LIGLNDPVHMARAADVHAQRHVELRHVLLPPPCANPSPPRALHPPVVADGNLCAVATTALYWGWATDVHVAFSSARHHLCMRSASWHGNVAAIYCDERSVTSFASSCEVINVSKTYDTRSRSERKPLDQGRGDDSTRCQASHLSLLDPTPAPRSMSAIWSETQGVCCMPSGFRTFCGDRAFRRPIPDHLWQHIFHTSYVVYRRWHCSHSRRRRDFPLALSLESITRLSNPAEWAFHANVAAHRDSILRCDA
jgi:hypothetical protein